MGVVKIPISEYEALARVLNRRDQEVHDLRNTIGYIGSEIAIYREFGGDLDKMFANIDNWMEKQKKKDYR